MEMYIQNPTTINCHVSGNNIEVDSKGFCSPVCRLKFTAATSLSMAFIGCHGCSTFFPTSVTKNCKHQIPFRITSINPTTRVENSPGCGEKSEKIEKRERSIMLYLQFSQEWNSCIKYSNLASE
jgi:hypothetical protein